MIFSVAIWWFVLLVLGWLAWPLTALLFAHSPGKGYAYSRVIGLLLLAYIFWLSGVLGLAPGSSASLWVVVAMLAGGGLLLWWRRGGELFATLRREWCYVLLGEGLFLALFALYAWHRSYDPAIHHTEQPMDFAFLNALLRSPRLPPDDPWLSGFPVSYYYFGYLIVAVMTRLSGLSAGVGYNLGLVQTAALAVLAAYGLLYDWLRFRERSSWRMAGLFASGGSLALVLAGNLEGILEWGKSVGLGSVGLYNWFSVPGLQETPTTGSWLPQDSWWWWHASRVFQDNNILGKNPTVITEFPAFSLILGDMHPHVMALPYVLVAVALAGELYRRGHAGLGRWWQAPGLWLIPIFFGSLGFINSWDLPTFVLLGVLALLAGIWVGRLHPRPSGQPGVSGPGFVPISSIAREGGPLGGRIAFSALVSGAERAEALCALAFLLWLGIGSIALYLPFYLTLTSQAQGISLAYYAKTSLHSYLLQFGSWLLPIVAAVVVEALQATPLLATPRADRPLFSRRRFLTLWAILWLLPWILTLVIGSPGRFLLGAGMSLVAGPWLLLFLSAILALVLLLAWHDLRGEGTTGDEAALFRHLLVLLGLGLTYATEFFYLRDLFDTRMNTIFKVYYQAWVLLGLGAVLSVVYLWRMGGRRRLVALGSALLLAAALYYPVAAAYSKAEGYSGQPTLDGTAFLQAESSEEYGAYLWLKDHAQLGDVLLEGVGEDYYPSHNRLSAWTGVPTVLGWPGHEAQWRGDDTLVAERLPDIEAIYTSTDAGLVLDLLHKYGVNYLYVGPYEQERYGIGAARLEWFASLFKTEYIAGDVRIYSVP